MLVNPAIYSLFRLCPNQLTNRLAFVEQHQCWYTTNTKLSCQLLMFIDIGFRCGEMGAVCFSNLVENWQHHLTWATPWSPKNHQSPVGIAADLLKMVAVPEFLKMVAVPEFLKMVAVPEFA